MKKILRYLKTIAGQIIKKKHENLSINDKQVIDIR